MQPSEYCAAKCAPPGSTLYYSLLFLDPRAHAAVAALHAFHEELAEVGRECTGPGVAQLKLGWWREELRLLRDGRPRHPVTRALAESGAVRVADDLEDIAHAIALDAGVTAYADHGEISLRGRRIHGAIARLGAAACGALDPRTLEAASGFGLAAALFESLQRARHDGLRAADDDLRRLGVEREHLRAGAGELLHGGAPVRALLELHMHRFDEALRDAFDVQPARERHTQLANVIRAEIQRAILSRFRRRPHALLARPVSMTPVAKLWVAWRVQRRDRRRARAAR